MGDGDKPEAVQMAEHALRAAALAYAAECCGPEAIDVLRCQMAELNLCIAARNLADAESRARAERVLSER